LGARCAKIKRDEKGVETSGAQIRKSVDVKEKKRQKKMCRKTTQPDFPL
jgi:hypothetical protein